MNDEMNHRKQPRRIWPWLVLAAVLLGIALFIVWVWFAVQGVKRIKASTEQASNRGTVESWNRGTVEPWNRSAISTV